MIPMKTGGFLVLCILGVTAVNSESKGYSSDSNSKPITKLSKVSEFYIGDLLRTPEKEQLETSSTMEDPISSTPEYLPAQRMDNLPDRSRLSTNYMIHGGHDYSGEFLPSVPQSRSPNGNTLGRIERSPVNVHERFLIKQAGVLERNVMSSEESLPVARRYARAGENPQYKPDCKKHRHSSEEEAYSAEERDPHHSTHAHPDQSTDYRNNHNSYQSYNSDHVSHGSSSSFPSHSRSYASDHASNTNSNSEASHSKSSSSSRTVQPKDRPEKVVVFDERKPKQPKHKKEYQQGHEGDGVVVYKMRETHNPETDSSSGETPVHGSNSGYNTQPVTEYYDQYPPRSPPHGYQKSSKRSPVVRNQESEYNTQPAQYVNGNYETSQPLRENQPEFREEYGNPHVHHPQHGYTQKTTSGSHGREQPARHYKSKNTEVIYVNEQSVQNRGQQHPNPYSARQENRHIENSNRHQYQHEPRLQSSRHRNGRQQASHDAYPTEATQQQTLPTYEKHHQILRPSETTTQQYAYNETPNTNYEADRKHHMRRRPSSRATRSSFQSAVDGRAQIQDGNFERGPQILITKASDPPVSRSVSYSESSYNMDQPTQSPPKYLRQEHQSRTYDEPQKMTNPLLTNKQARDPGYQSAYKPHNSEYPASYANDQYDNGHYKSQRNIDSQSYEEPNEPYEEQKQPLEGPQDSYEEPHQQYHGQSHDGPDQPYNDDGEHEDAYSQKDSHKTKSDITGYKDVYDSHEPLELDDDFFAKYGISKSAKVIVATSMKPNLFVADGTNIKEGSSNDGPKDEEYYERKPYSEEDTYQPTPQTFEHPQHMPGSFTELVDTNPNFLRKLTSSNADEFPEHSPSLDELIFRSSHGDPKAFVHSQGSREIVQQHGNGVSRIIFNQPTEVSKAAASENSEQYQTDGQSRESKNLQEEKSEIVETIVKANPEKDTSS